MHIPLFLQIKERQGCLVCSKKDEVLEGAIIYPKIHINRQQTDRGFRELAGTESGCSKLGVSFCLCLKTHISKHIAHEEGEHTNTDAFWMTLYLQKEGRIAVGVQPQGGE